MAVAIRIRLLLAIWVGKAVFKLSQLAGKKGTTLPGALALKLCPELIGLLARKLPKGTILVTGTNGKTTTANMLAEILTAAGFQLTFNRAGANLITGVATAFLNSATWSGRILSEMALLEVDEAAMVKVAPLVNPKTIVITNFFRDQLDRYGELDKTVSLVRDTILSKLSGTKLVLNADDPLVAQIGVNRKGTVFYGVAPNRYSSTDCSQSREAKYCGFCGHTYEYELFHYGQLGIYHCPKCSFARPNPDVLAAEVDLGEGVSFRLDNAQIRLHHQGFYNVYNALAAAAAAISLNLGTETIKRGLEDFVPQAGRMERFQLAGKAATLSLVKNPTGFNEVIRAMVHGGRPLSLVIAINDNAADGRDVSWLWDVDFEQLGGKIDLAICSGKRAEDMAVRLKYSGIEVEKISVIKELDVALQKLAERSKPDQGIYILPTYTALFPMRDLLNKVRGKAYAS